ncbi:uncharacterized protein MYCFIDRAFT_85039 [Pseudocercospora fijiensis CIRAD86]|uniref:Uncharacterized protein n=1 Tax=Pseudocercospora fijiensis (strain CIRAD86) TaxID=383855 RepID=N1QBL2_PSEFD|nr:uncharacterized protein MYCFIDRAFT_85039 [Pseudocercospora fijiensis CIRAD86]EME88592.1 hypothetical protein MYCFIDRAFT_85039 [Pseudocercospora fijiensis CIRAD86]
MKWWQRDFLNARIEELARHQGGIVFNPLLVKKLAETPGEVYSKDALYNPKFTSSFHRNLLGGASEDASCTRMLISQPPLTFMTSSIEVADEPLPLSDQNGSMFAIARALWVPRRTIVADDYPFPKPYGLGHGRTLAELRDSLRDSLQDHQVILPGALWTSAWAGSRNVDTL